LAEDEDWIATYENQRKRLISEETNIDSIKTQMRQECQNKFQEIKAKVETILFNCEKRLLNDINKSTMKVFNDLDVQFKDLKSLNFKGGDIFNKIDNVIHFEHNLKHSLKRSIELRNQTIADWQSPFQSVLDGLSYLMENIFSKVGSEKTIDSLISEIQKLKEALNGDFEKNLNELRCQNERFQKQIQDLKSQLKEVPELREELERRNDHIQDLKNELGDESKLREELEGEIDSLERQNEDLEDRLNEESELREELERKNDKFERRIEDLQNKLEEESELEEKLERKNQRIQKLKNKLGDESKLREELEGEIDSLERQNEDLENRLYEESEQREKRERQNKSLKSKIKDLKCKCEDLRNLRLDCPRGKY